MKKTAGHTPQAGSAIVELLDDYTIVCRLAGNITGEVVGDSMKRTKQLVDEIQGRGQARLLLDISQITHQTSEARTQAKDLGDFGFERIAVCGGSRPITMMGRYIAQAGGMGAYTRFFGRERAAIAWLKHGDRINDDDNKLMRRNVVALLLAVIGISTLAGWMLDVPALRAVIPTFQPMNPITAVTLLLYALSLTLMTANWQRSIARRFIVGFVGWWSVLIGLLVFVRYGLGLDLHADNFFVAEHLQHSAMYVQGRVGPSAAASFIAVGTMLLLMAADTRQRWQRVLFFTLAYVVALQALIVLVAYSFGFEKIYELSSYLPMPLNTALALLLFIHAAGVLVKPTKIAAFSIKIFNNYWQAVILTLFLLLATGVAWHQTKRDVTKNIDTNSREVFTKATAAVRARLAAYSDALNGYKGLFASSSDVAPDEFHNYFVTSGLSTNYPGFTAITYAAVVPEGAKQTFISQTRARASAQYPRYKDFTIFPNTTNALHYPLLYVEPGRSTTTFGFDLGSEQVRRQTLERARDSGEPVASGIIDLNASRGGSQPTNYGFFLSTPIYKNSNGQATVPASTAGRQQRIQGFVIAYFQNSLLFGDIFKSLTDSNVKFVIADTDTHTQLYTSKATAVPAGVQVKQIADIQAGGRTWQVAMYISPEYGRSELYKALPWAVLFSGAVLTTLAGSLALAQLRRRDQALQIASRMTEDLSNERNRAVATQRKDEAILSSIGDAVFAIDRKERITLFNQACVDISGVSAQEAIGKPYSEILKFRFEKTNKPNSSFVKQALAGHVTSMKNHTVLIRRDGKSVAVADSAAPIHDARGNLRGAIIVFRDVSREQELDRAKTEFVSLASHQLRTPLSAIGWYGELLLGGDAGTLTKDQHAYVQEIYDGNQRMIELVDSLLDVSRLDLGKLSNKPVPNNMKQLIESLERELRISIEGKQLSFYKQLQGKLPEVWADPKLLRMIVQNLLSNAVKYTPEKGQVHIIIRDATESEIQTAKLALHHSYFFMSVADTGYGIPKTQQPKIFSKLFRADNVRSMDVEGTGLGLYIVKEVVEKLGGRVWFTSIESVGSTFYVILPYRTNVVTSEGGGVQVGD